MKTSQEVQAFIAEVRERAASDERRAAALEALLYEREGYERTWTGAQGVADAVPDSVPAQERAAAARRQVDDVDAAIAELMA